MTMQEDGRSIDDGLYVTYVNAEIKDGTLISDYAAHFIERIFNDPRFPKTTKRVQEVKNEEEAVREMSDTMQALFDKYTVDLRKEIEEYKRQIEAEEYKRQADDEIQRLKKRIQELEAASA